MFPVQKTKLSNIITSDYSQSFKTDQKNIRTILQECPKHVVSSLFFMVKL